VEKRVSISPRKSRIQNFQKLVFISTGKRLLPVHVSRTPGPVIKEVQRIRQREADAFRRECAAKAEAFRREMAFLDMRNRYFQAVQALPWWQHQSWIHDHMDPGRRPNWKDPDFPPKPHVRMNWLFDDDYKAALATLEPNKPLVGLGGSIFAPKW